MLAIGWSLVSITFGARPRGRIRSRCGTVGAGVLCRLGEEGEAELADLDLVAVGEHGGVGGFAVEVGAVKAADVSEDDVSRPVSVELDVAA